MASQSEIIRFTTIEEAERFVSENKGRMFSSQLPYESHMLFTPIAARMHDFGYTSWYPVVVFRRRDTMTGTTKEIVQTDTGYLIIN